MSTPDLVRAFYERIWNAGDLGAAEELLASGLSFRGSLGTELQGRDAFLEGDSLRRLAETESAWWNSEVMAPAMAAGKQPDDVFGGDFVTRVNIL